MQKAILYTAWMMAMVAPALTFGQNLVPNYSFEEYTECPEQYHLPGEPLECIPWVTPTDGSSDYFNVCCGGCNVWIPDNLFGSQESLTGVAYGGIYAASNINGNQNYREYYSAPLNESLLPGFAYYVSFYVSPADEFCAVPQIGALFTAGLPIYVPEPPFYSNYGVLDYSPQIEYYHGFLNDFDGWTQISGCFLANGGETHITIGNFHDDLSTPLHPDCVPPIDEAYYYIEDVEVIQMLYDVIPLDLGGPVTACSSYEIEPGISDVFYTWEDGSHGLTLTVTESGTYALTIADGCSFGIDSIEVEIIGSSPVEIEEDSITLCAGETYEIELDPDLGEYTWNDGSNETNYIITSPGLYSVTLDDGCDLTTDEIEVIGLDVPAAFSLGNDQILCPGESISINFDPDLGDFHWQDNSSSSSYTIQSTGSYALTISNECGFETDEMDVTAGQLPTIEIGAPEMILCMGSTITIDLDPDMGEYVWQDGSNSTTYAISTPGLYTVTVSNFCGTAIDMVNVTLIEIPTLVLHDDVTLCPAELPITIDAAEMSNANSFEWNDGSTNSWINIFQAGTYTVTGYNECFAVMDEINITTLDHPPVVILPDDQVLCSGSILVLFNEGDDGHYAWQDLSDDETYVVTGPGIYSLTVSNACGSGHDSVIIDYLTPIEPLDLGPDVSLCPGETLLLDPGIVNANYLWNDQSHADTFLVTSPGTYSVHISDACSMISDTLQVTFDASGPQLDLPSPIVLCSGQQTTIESGLAGVNFLWSDGSIGSSISVSNPGTYILTVSNNCGTDVDTSMVLDGGPAPSVELGGDVSICSGDQFVLIPTYSEVNNWLWHDGSTDTSFTITSPGLIIVQVANDCGISNDTLTSVMLPDVPALSIGADTSLCPGESFQTSIDIPGVDILWSDGGTDSVLDITGPGWYYGTISNTCSQSTDSIFIAALADIPSLNLGPDQSFCPGELITLSPGIEDVNYLWQNGSTDTFFITTQPQVISLTISNTCGVAVDTLILTESTDGPQVDLGTDILACEGEMVTVSPGVLGVQYLWHDGSTLPEYSSTVTELVIVQVSNACGLDSDTILVQIDGVAPIINLGPDTTLCNGETLLLQVAVDAETELLWSDNSSGHSNLISQPGLIFLTATHRCGTDQDSINVNFQQGPAPFDLGNDTLLCPGQSVILVAPATQDIITWQDGSSGSSYTADQEGIYSLEIANACGSAIDAVEITFDHHTIHTDLGVHEPLCPPFMIELDVTQDFETAYLWNTGTISPVLTIITPGTYIVSIQSYCENATAQIEILQSSDCDPHQSFFIPNVFSPNGDQINDVFTFSVSSSIEVQSIEVHIFDRWGNQVFSAGQIPVNWDGTFKGELLQSAVFTYVIRLEYIYQDRLFSQSFAGDVTLIR